MGYATIREVVLRDLGAPPEELFKDFSRTALAAGVAGSLYPSGRCARCSPLAALAARSVAPTRRGLVACALHSPSSCRRASGDSAPCQSFGFFANTLSGPIPGLVSMPSRCGAQ
jgi:hypothetical protein